MLKKYLFFPKPWVDGFAVQQQPERDPGWRDGIGQDDPDDRPDRLPDGEEEEHGALPYHRSPLNPFKLDARGWEVGAHNPGTGVQRNLVSKLIYIEVFFGNFISK